MWHRIKRLPQLSPRHRRGSLYCLQTLDPLKSRSSSSIVRRKWWGVHFILLHFWISRVLISLSIFWTLFEFVFDLPPIYYLMLILTEILVMFCGFLLNQLFVYAWLASRSGSVLIWYPYPCVSVKLICAMIKEDCPINIWRT